MATVGAVVVVVAGVAAVALVARGVRLPASFGSNQVQTRPPLAGATMARTATPAVNGAGHVEIPDVVGMPLAQARTLLQAAALAVRVAVIPTAAPAAEQDVESQDPVSGSVVMAGSAVSLRVPPTAKVARVTALSGHKGPLVVVIDPGHQSRADTALEPVGPGAAATQPKATTGSTGAATGIPEYEIDLQIATNLKDRLTAAGVRAILTRTTNDEDFSDAQRAQIANTAKATLFVRIHADTDLQAGQTGVCTFYPASNHWTKPFSALSKKAAELVQGAVVAATGARDNGEVARADQAGFNWAKVPCVLVNTGNPANVVEDRLLTSAHYQDLLAQGMTNGILDYCGKGR